MWPFGRKSREAPHRQILEKARNALERLGVTPYTDHRGDIHPRWADPYTVRLEFRTHIYPRVGNLVFHAHGPEVLEHLGDAEWMLETVEDLAFVQKYLSGNFTSDQVAAFRALAFRTIQDQVVEETASLAKEVALDKWSILTNPDDLTKLVRQAREALAWFPSEADLIRACDLARRLLKADVSGVSVRRLREAADDLEKPIPRFIEMRAGRGTAKASG
jgi:hypothetical protein